MHILRNVGAGGAAVLDDATIAAVQQTLAGAGGAYAPMRALFVLTSANMNVDTDQSFTKLGTFTNWLIQSIIFTNSSISMTTAVGGIYTAAAKGGIAIVANTQVYSGAAGANHGAALTVGPGAGRGVLTATPILSLTTPQGAAATGDFYIWGTPLT